MVRSSIWQIAAFALLGPCLTLASEDGPADEPQGSPIGLDAPGPAQAAAKQEAGAELATETRPAP